MSDKSQPQEGGEEPDQRQRDTWHKIAVEFAENFIERGPCFVSAESAEAIAQTILAQEAALKNARLIGRLHSVRADQAEAREAGLREQLDAAERRAEALEKESVTDAEAFLVSLEAVRGGHCACILKNGIIQSECLLHAEMQGRAKMELEAVRKRTIGSGSY